jgi:anti-sigma factor RsiW
MKETTHDVILDLLPLYLAGEVSEDTAALVKKYLESNPELAETAKQMAKADSLNKVPIPFRKEAAMKTYEEAKKWTVIRTLGLVGIISVVSLCALITALLFITMFVK